LGYNHTSPELHNAERAAEEHLARLTDVRVPRPFVSITKLDNEKVILIIWFLLCGVNLLLLLQLLLKMSLSEFLLLLAQTHIPKEKFVHAKC
jgi:hypothetical protein